MAALRIIHFSDVLCIWAYVGQGNLERLMEDFDGRIEVETRFCSVFPDTQGKIEKVWSGRGGFDGYSEHVHQTAGGFGVLVHKDTWSKTRPKSSASPHLFIKAIASLDDDETRRPFQDRLTVRAAKALRSAFFADAQDISDWAVQREVCQQIGIDFADIQSSIESGQAIASLAEDYELSQASHVRGSPTYILNEGRQVLFGNISYGILEANVRGLLSEESDMNASIC